MRVSAAFGLGRLSVRFQAFKLSVQSESNLNSTIPDPVSATRKLISISVSLSSLFRTVDDPPLAARSVAFNFLGRLDISMSMCPWQRLSVRLF